MKRKTLAEDVGDALFMVLITSGFFGLVSYLAVSMFKQFDNCAPVAQPDRATAF